MKCPNCKREYNEPLILSNGQFVCPKCFLSIVNKKNIFSFTEENIEYYKLSQIAFLEGLKKQDDNLILKSIELAKESYSLGNPEALLHLGYCYDKDFVEKDKTEKYRTLIAYEYYSTIAYSKQSDSDFTSTVDFTNTKRKAANLLLNMLSSFQDKKTEERYTVEYNYQRLETLIPNLEKPNYNSSVKSKSSKEKIMEYLFSKGVGKPILSIYKMTFKELNEILDDDNFKKRYKDINIKYRQESEFISAISTNLQYDECKEYCESKSNSTTYVILYNKKYKFKYIKFWNKSKVEALLKDNNQNILSIIENSNFDEIYISEDDIYYASKGKRISSRIMDELQNIIKEG